MIHTDLHLLVCLKIPQSPGDNTLKIQTEERITTLEKAARSGLPEDFVNATFAIGNYFLPMITMLMGYCSTLCFLRLSLTFLGGLKSSMSKGEGGVYLYRLMETRGVLRTTIGMLKCSVESEEMAEKAMHINPEEVRKAAILTKNSRIHIFSLKHCRVFYPITGERRRR